MKKIREIGVKIEDAYDTSKFKLKDKLNLFDPVIIYPYRGFGNEEKALIHGRILEKEHVIHEDQDLRDTLWNNIRKVWKRYESDEIPGVEIEGDLSGIKAKTTSDDEGYFTLHFEGLESFNLTNGWHEATIRITNMPFKLKYEESTKAQVLIHHQDHGFGIISDVDDTIIKSFAMNTIKKIRILLTQSVHERVAFEGVDLLYRKLHARGQNPLFFISGSSFNLYDILIKFCQYQNIPDAPFLLRDLGLTPAQWLKQDTMPYKKENIEIIMKMYDKLRFVLIGDSGQKDPEIYSDIHKNYPDRIKAIYIRHVLADKRKEELEEMARNIDVPFLVMSHSKDALKHAADMGWINV